MNGPHGHVTPRPDGQRARCGGPGICPQCSRERLVEVSETGPSESELLAVDCDARLLFGQLCQIANTHSGSGPKLATIRRFLAMRDAKRALPAAQVFLESAVGTPQGRIVSSSHLTPHQVAEAQSLGRWFVTSSGLGFANLPWALTTDMDRAREHGWDNMDKAIKPTYTETSVRAIDEALGGEPPRRV